MKNNLRLTCPFFEAQSVTVQELTDPSKWRVFCCEIADEIMKKPMGRPVIPYNPEIGEMVLDCIMHGMTLREIAEIEGVPSIPTLFKWLREEKEFFEQYGRAREVQADVFVDETIDIADDSRNDWIARKSENGEEFVLNNEHISRSKVRIESRRWSAGKFHPKKYGDKQQVEHTGAVNITVTSEDANL